jgi:hypothetical protein
LLLLLLISGYINHLSATSSFFQRIIARASAKYTGFNSEL